MINAPLRFLRFLLFNFCVCSLVAAYVFADPPTGFPWIDPTGIAGSLLVCGENEPSTAVMEKLSESTKDELRTVVIRQTDHSSPAALDNLPGAVVHCGPFDDKHRAQLLAAVTEHPDRVGFCVPPGSAMLIRGRHIELLDGQPVTIMLAASAGRHAYEIELAKVPTHDFAMLRRAAIERSLANFPSQVLPPP
jgi:hypothetical protein